MTLESGKPPDAASTRRGSDPAPSRTIAIGRLRLSPWTLALAFVLGGGLGLRLWGISHGLPYVYNLDEGAHFVPNAISYFKGTLNPEYFINPPAYSYVLHAAFSVWFGGREGASQAYATDPTEIFTLARVITALIGIAALAVLYAAGRRLFDERVGVAAAAAMAVGFLPVFYSKLALNDVPTLLPLAFALYGIAGLATRERRRDWLYAGVGIGLAAAFKYTAGIMLVPLLVVGGYRLLLAETRRPAMRGLVLAAAVALVAFVAANPYALLDWSTFSQDITKQQSAAGEVGKLGQEQSSGHLYYLWTMTWGLGWGAAVMALGGAVMMVRERLLAGLLLIVPAVLFIAYMGAQGRFFGRWLLPVLPLIALLAAYAAVRGWELVRERRPGLATLAGFALALALVGQGIVYSVHSGIVLAREDTRNIAREWLVSNVPAGGKLVIEPIVPQAYIQDPDGPHPVTPVGDRWIKYPSGKTTIDNQGRSLPRGRSRIINVEDYERIVRPALLKDYRARGFCWVMIGSTQYGRAFSEPEKVPNAMRYYRDLNRRGTPVFAALPYRRQAQVGFNFDWSFDYYPLAYRRPGPEVFIYRISGPLCDPMPRRPGAPALDVDRWLR